METIRLTHFFTHFNKLGGVESVLKNHLANDLQWGIASRVLAFFEPAATIEQRVTGLGLTWRDTVASTRRKFRRASDRFACDVAFYHNFWGIPFLADADLAQRRMALLHTDSPGIRLGLPAQRGLVDGVLCVNTVLRDQAIAALPSLAAERIAVAPLPIDAPKTLPHHSPLRNRPLVVGFCGRVVKEQKRVDRLIELCARLDAMGVDYQFEILGDGPERAWLEQQFATNRRVRFHGRQTGARYWEILSGWDAIVFTSDYEGLPIALLEALSRGVIPVHPRIQSGGDDYTARVDRTLVYGAGDVQQAARLLSRLGEMGEEHIASLREKCRNLAAPHLGDGYLDSFAEFIRQISQQPKITPDTYPPRHFYWSDYCPFGLMRRIFYRGFYRRNDGW